MNTTSRKLERGAALIIVLASLTFLSVLTVAFLMNMRSKLALSKSGSDSSEVKMLAETAVNIAISQVRDATKKSGTANLAWASQPGMVRLYDNSGNAAGYYKLYSADDMVATGGAFNSGTTTPSDPVPEDWAANPAVFTDLNTPADGVFPILDYAAATTLEVQGFALNSPPTIGTTNPAPMPVKWLYVLKDGSLHTADPSSSGTKAVVPAATKDNPIVGRVAFWADDETCKVNVNTASEGTFWATPRFNTTGDRLLATSQPTRGEYQRYPGHPATVSLTSVFSRPPSDTPEQWSQKIFAIAPRLSWGGSEGATKDVSNASVKWIDSDKDRLYASVDEVLLKTNSTTDRAVQDGLTKANVEGARFFLTASSRAPELNLFGLPRIATWPIHAVNDNNYRTVNDRLIAFCSTLGVPPTTYPFYFTRQENLRPKFDISLPRNTKLLNYLDWLTGKPIPGFGGNFQADAKYGQEETRQILTEIFDYIRCTNLVDKTTPQNPAGYYPYTFGTGSLGLYAKGSQDHGRNRSLGTAAPAYREDWNTRGFGGRFLQVRAAHIHFVAQGNADTPIDPAQLGVRDPSIVNNVVPANRTAVQAYIYLSLLNPSEGVELWSPGHWIEIEGLDQFAIELNPTDSDYTSLGFPAKDPGADAIAQSKNTMIIAGNMLGSLGYVYPGMLSGGQTTGSRVVTIDPFFFTYEQNFPKTLSATTPVGPSSDPNRQHFPFFSKILPVDSTSPTMAFQGGLIKIRVYADPPYPTVFPYIQRGELIQELSLEFPSADFPTPLLATNRVVGSGTTSVSANRWISPSSHLDLTKDVFRTIPLRDGDIRLLIGPSPTSRPYFFEAQPEYSSTTTRISTGQNASAQLVSGATYSGMYPLIPGHLNGAFTTPSGALGDWDNGTGMVGDGPFINAPDAGNVDRTAGTTNYFSFSRMSASQDAGAPFFSPNRMMPGPGMFGSLSTGVKRRLPWQTLLFRPGPPNHPGAVSPPDHLLLDLFWMPVVEPYAISEPFSTAGKINMNQQLVPFTYINRTAGLRAALAAEQVAMVSKNQAALYKKDNPAVAGLTNARLALNLSETDGTLRQFKEKFDRGEIFRSATEICDIYLVPVGKTWPAAKVDWYGDDFAMVGDNTRERPYAHIYNKLTTKSNTFTVYYHAQVLQKPKARNTSDSDAKTFDTSAGDKVLAAQRGSTTFERYLDPADPKIVDKDPAATTATSLEEFYRARIINTSVFNP